MDRPLLTLKNATVWVSVLVAATYSLFEAVKSQT